MFLLEIFNEIHKIKPDSKLILIGDGEDKEKILNKINQLKLENAGFYYKINKLNEKIKKKTQ